MPPICNVTNFARGVDLMLRTVECYDTTGGVTRIRELHDAAVRALATGNARRTRDALHALIAGVADWSNDHIKLWQIDSAGADALVMAGDLLEPEDDRICWAAAVEETRMQLVAANDPVALHSA